MPDYGEFLELPYHTANGTKRYIALYKPGLCASSDRTRQWTEVSLAASFRAMMAYDRSAALLDIGAHVGGLTVVAADLFASVHAFEPSPDTRRLLEATVRVNGFQNVTIHPVALSDVTGTAPIYRNPVNRANDSLTNHFKNHELSETVMVVPGDALLAGKVAKIAYIKMDCEGQDIRALRGLERTIAGLESLPPIRFEFCPNYLKNGGSTVDDLLAFIDRFGYVPALDAGGVHGPLSPGVLRGLFADWVDTLAWIDVNLVPPERLRTKG